MNINTLNNLALGIPSYTNIMPVTKPDGQIVGVPIPQYVYSTAKLFAKNSWNIRTPQIIISDDNHYYNAKFNYFLQNNRKLIGINMVPVNNITGFSHLPLIVAQRNSVSNPLNNKIYHFEAILFFVPSSVIV